MKVFEPALYSLEENAFLAEHAGEPPTVALHGTLPPGVNPKAVKPALEKFYELCELEKHRGAKWVGVDAIKQACRTYLQAYESWMNARRRGAPFPPTMFTWDQRGRAHRGAVDSDSAYARTYFNAKGERLPLGVKLEVEEAAYTPEWLRPKPAPATPQALLVDEEKGLVTCPVCHFTVNFEPGVQSKLNMAKAQMARHLTSARKDPESHRLLYAAVFGAPDPAAN